MPLNTNLIYRVIYSPTEFIYAVADAMDGRLVVDYYSTAKRARLTGRSEVVPVSEAEFKTMRDA
jgi:hypothetical protein